MADPALKLDTELNINLRKLDRDIANISKRLSKASTIQIDDRASGPLGRITGNAKDFDKSLNAATQRVVAFGAAAAVFNTLQNSFTNLVKSVINVEDSLAKINVNLGQSQQQIAGFANEIFKAAGATGKTFEEAAKGAEELARQGLGAEETIKRLNDALILSRLAGIDTTSAVESLTAAVNSFQNEAVTTTDVLNKFVAVDTRFAVSTRDLQEAISRVGSTAGEAGVSLDELNGIVTAVQQSTARGGAVIGNAFKTIFTRLARPETLTQLEELGVGVRDLQGNALPAIQILKNFAAIQDTLSESQKQSTKELVAGVFQINILNAALNDLGKNYSITERAQRASSGATDEAIQKNAQLNETLKSQINQAAQLTTQFFAKIGDAGASGPFASVIKGFNDLLVAINGADGDTVGKVFGDSLIQGIANVLSGPGLAVALGAMYKAVVLITKSIKDDLKGLLDVTGASGKRLEVEKQIAVTLSKATEEEREQFALVSSIAEKKALILSISQRIAAAEGRQNVQNAALTGSLVGNKGFGKVPNYADPLGEAIEREKKAGVNPKDIYIGQDSRLKSPQNPMGLLVANRRDEPMGGAQGVNRAIAEGKNPKTYQGGGAVPNFAEFDKLQRSVRGGKVKDVFGNVTNLPFEEQIGPNEAKQLRSVASKVRTANNPEDFSKAAKELESLAKTLGITNEGFAKINTVTQNAAQKLGKVLVERQIEEKAAADAASILAKRENAENEIRARDFQKAQKELPKEKIPKVPTEEKPKELTTDQKAEQLLGNKQTKKQKDTTDKEIKAFEQDQARIEKQNSQRRVAVTRNYAKQQKAAADAAEKLQKEEEDIRKKTISDARKSAKNGTLFQETPAPLPPVAPKKINRGGGAKSSNAAFEATRKQSPGSSDVLYTNEVFRKQQVESAKTSLERESLSGVIQDTLRRAASGIVPTDKEIKRIEGVASRQVLNSPEFQGFTRKEIVSGSAPKEIVSLYKERLREQIQGFRKNVEQAQLIALRETQNANFGKAQDILGGSKKFSDLFSIRAIRERRAQSRAGIPFFDSFARDEALLSSKGIDTKNQDVRGLLEQRKQSRQSRNSSAALGLSFLAPFLAGALPEGQGGTGSGRALGALQGALNFGATGATIGSFFGPGGTAIGAGVGTVVGAGKGFLDKLNKSAAELSEEFQRINDVERGRIQSIEQYIQIQEQLNEALKNGASSGTVNRFRERRESILGGVDSGTRKVLESLGSDIDELSKFSDKQGIQFNKNQREQVAAVKLLEELGSGGAGGVGLRDAGFLGKFLDRALSFRNENGLPGLGLPSNKRIKDLSSSIIPAIQSNPEFGDLLRSSRRSLTQAGSDAPTEGDLTNINKVIDKLRSSSKEFTDIAPVTARSFLLVRDALVDASIQADKNAKLTKEQVEIQKKAENEGVKRGQRGLFSGGSLTQSLDPFNAFGQSLSGAKLLQQRGGGAKLRNPLANEGFLNALESLKSLKITNEQGQVSSSLGLGSEADDLNKRITEIKDLSEALVNQEKAYRAAADLILAVGPSEGLNNISQIFNQFGQVNKAATESLLKTLKNSKDQSVRLIAELVSAGLIVQSEATQGLLPPKTKPEIYRTNPPTNPRNPNSVITFGSLPPNPTTLDPRSRIYRNGAPKDFGSAVNTQQNKADFYRQLTEDSKKQFEDVRKTSGRSSPINQGNDLPADKEFDRKQEALNKSLTGLQSLADKMAAEQKARLIKLDINIDNVVLNPEEKAMIEEALTRAINAERGVSTMNGKPPPPKTNSKGEYTEPLTYRQRIDLYSKYNQP